MRRNRLAVIALLPAVALATGLVVPCAWAEPSESDEQNSVPEIPSVAEGFVPTPDQASVPDQGGPAREACDRFSAALALAAANYEEFAYATAGNGDYVNYDDPNVQRANVVGRTALREAASVARDAAAVAGLPPEVGDPMRDWSLHAAKLVLIMGLRGGGNSLNDAANELNGDADRVQLACAVSLGSSPAG